MRACTLFIGSFYPREGDKTSRASSHRRNVTQDPGASSCSESVNSGKFQLHWPVPASLTSGSLLFVSDCLAQSIERLGSNGRSQNKTQYFRAPNERPGGCREAPEHFNDSEIEFNGGLIGKERPNFHHVFHEHDVGRTARMAVYGFIFYGPILNLWFQNLDRLLPQKNVTTTFAKVALSQTTLNPALLAFVFAYNYAWTGRVSELKDKYLNDFFPTMRNGWRFWVPASIVNFALVPLPLRLGFSSSCSLIWNCYVSMCAAR